MKSKIIGTAMALAIAMMLSITILGVGQNIPNAPSTLSINDFETAQKPAEETSWSELLADKIIVGLVSEKEFRKMNLPFEQIVEVFKHIRDKRGWTIDDESLATALSSLKPSEPKAEFITPSVVGNCSEWIELESGSSFAAYPVSRSTTNECGGDNDALLIYNTPKYPNTQTYNLRVYSQLWWVRSTIASCYGGVSANSLCSSQARVCIGSCAKWLGSDLNYLYLWHK